MIGGFQSDLSITCMIDENLFSKVGNENENGDNSVPHFSPLVGIAGSQSGDS